MCQLKGTTDLLKMNTVSKFNIISGWFFFSFLFLMGCGDDELEYSIPTTYNFENVSYTGQTQRLAMFQEMKSYMAESQTLGVTLDANRLIAMYANDAANADFANTYDESKQLQSKTLSTVEDHFLALLVELAVASESTENGADGISGVIQSVDGAKSYLVGEDGLDHAQVFEKGLMGACLYYQATSVYFGAGKMEVDNETIVEGEGTEMEHHWDEAFGYFGVPTDFPISKDGIVFLGSYSDQRDEMLNTNQLIMDAYLKGRAAISAGDLEVRDEAILEAREGLELVMAGSAIHYLNASMTNFDDMALRSHGLSEAIGFIYGLQFNEGKKISNNQVNDLLELIAGANDFSDMNLYNTTVSNLKEARDELAAILGLTDIKEAL